MKKAVVVMMLLGLLAVITPAYAGDVDGLWIFVGASDTSQVSFGMVRENADILLVTILTADTLAWIPMYGPFDGTNANLSLLLTSESNGNFPATFTGSFSLTSPTTGAFTTTSCTNFPQQDNCPPNGFVFNGTKLF
ncbi:MAG: hypothetical protein ACM3MB_09630 [Acidobacteriota bacterium]